LDGPQDTNEDENLGDAAGKDGYASDDADDIDAKTARKSAENKPQASYDEPDEDDIIPEENEKSLEDEEAEFEQAILAGADDDDEAPKRVSSKGGKIEKQAIEKSKYCTKFNFDDVNGAFCEIDMEFPADTKKILMVSLIEKSCARVVVHEVKGISKCFEYINPTENDTSVSLYLCTTTLFNKLFLIETSSN
jgi:DNA-directed RNA polymerase I subunit RPA1